jgi:hypothetical protein
MSKLEKTLNIFSVVFLLIFAVFAIILGWLNPNLGESGILLFAISYCCAVIPLGLISSTWLVWTNRSRFFNGFIWLAFQLLFVISMGMYTLPGFSLFFSSLLFILFPLLGIVNFLYAYQKGASLKFIAWGSVAFIWSILLAWKVTGNLLEKWVGSISTSSNDLWWSYALMYGTAWMVAAGLIAFLVETIRALHKEFSGA